MRYKNPSGFRQGVTQRIRDEANTKGVPAARRQMRFLFERFWLRLERAFPVVVVKGGAALEFRLDRARTTRDLDLSVSRVPGDELLERLQAACREDFGDFLTFQVVEDSTLDNEGQRYEGRRLSVTCLLNNQPLFSRFGLDIAVGEPSGAAEVFTIATSPTAAELVGNTGIRDQPFHSRGRLTKRKKSYAKDLKAKLHRLQSIVFETG